MDPVIYSAVEDMLSRYSTRTIQEKINALKEVLQEVLLFALARSGFFEYAAFYGGTALRIFYHLDRFSEDLDFSLVKPDPDFSLASVLDQVQNLLAGFGLKMTVEEKMKHNDSSIRSAFLKAGTKEQILTFFPADNTVLNLHPDERIKIKFEVDILPPGSASFENKISMLPFPYSVRLYDLPSLFAGKIHAVLCRGWKNRVKGRDLYDYAFYIGRNTGFNLDNLNEKLIESRFCDHPLTAEEVKAALKDRFAMIDYAEARRDVEPFLHPLAVSSLDLWGPDYFSMLTDRLEAAGSKR